MKMILGVILLSVPLSSQANCTLAIENFAFGAYSPASYTPLEAAGNIAVSCDGGVGPDISYTLAINAGSSGSFVSRKMIYGPYALNYNLYLNAARTTIWGDGNVGTGIVVDGYASIAGKNVRNYTVYGRIPVSQAVPPGAYNDSLIVTLTY
ncbi:MAG: spore coat U domain-containing protein [Gallionella sp.]|nr:spore coat U domain-containing protein [Gallionella sp.]MDP1942064.1 spore coat U domain-containing protein [Gallionella sp.]